MDPAEQAARVELCPSCDGRHGFGRDWSVWVGDVRLVHAIYKSEGDAIVDLILTRERAARREEIRRCPEHSIHVVQERIKELGG